MNSIALYERARSALAECRTVNDVLTLRAEMDHLKLHARHVRDRALMADALEIQIWAERRLGELIDTAEKDGLIRIGRPKKRDIENPPGGEAFTLKEAGITHKLSAKAQKLSSISERAVQSMVDGMRARVAGHAAIIIDPVAAHAKEQRDDERRRAHEERTFAGGDICDLRDLAASGFRASVILADPPWHFLARSEKGEGRSASLHYTTDRTDDFEAIKALPVRDLAADDCVLFMWMVDWCPKQALEIIEAWGFAHKTTAFTWVKLLEQHDGLPRHGGVIGARDFHLGQGYWTRANPEDCWLATRGSPKRLYADVRQLVVSPLLEHSRKPDDIHDRIMRLVDGPYLELYARRERHGWKTWGNELSPESLLLPPHDPDTGEITDGTPQMGAVTEPAPESGPAMGAGHPSVDEFEIPDWLRRTA